MNVEDVINLADHLVFTQTGKHLDDLQQDILRETFQCQHYAKIAEDRNLTEGYVKTTASNLWKTLSDQIGEKIRKSNVSSTLERLTLSNFYHHNQDCIQITDLRVCSDSATLSNPHPSSSVTTSQPREDLGIAPEVNCFYGRKEELKTLKNWILQDKIRLINMVGICGIGKTTLARQLIEEIKGNFEVIIWRSLYFSPCLETTLKNLLKILTNESEISGDIEDNLSQILAYFRRHRCLVVLDDGDSLFNRGCLAGQYKSGYEDYGLFLNAIADSPHHSCCLFLSQEPPKEISQQKSKKAPVRTLELAGLGESAQEFFREKDLKSPEDWSTLIEMYQGHPLWLQLIITLIEDQFQGEVKEFLSYDTLFLADELKDQLQEQLNRLSPLEIAILKSFCPHSKPLSLGQIIHFSQHPFQEVLNGIQSLSRRCLIKTVKAPETLYQLDPVLHSYLNDKTPVNQHNMIKSL